MDDSSIDPRLQPQAPTPAHSHSQHQPPVHGHDHDVYPQTTLAHHAPPHVATAVKASQPTAFGSNFTQSTSFGNSASPGDDAEDGAEHVGGSRSGTDLESPNTPNVPNDPKRLRACDACRALKVRCDQIRPELPCLRCKKANRLCHTTPSTRKRQKKGDSRVAELERKVEYLTSVLTKNIGTNASQHEELAHKKRRPSKGIPCRPPSPDIPTILASAQSSSLGIGTHGESQGHQEATEPDRSDICRRLDQLIAPDVADNVFKRYVDDISPRFPAVPVQMSAQEMRQKKPFLFLAIIAGCCTGSDMQQVERQPQHQLEQDVGQRVQQALGDLFKHYLGQIMIFDSEKSLEVIQALQVGTLWYRPPLRYDQHNFCLMVNCAVAIANQLRLTRPASPDWLPKPPRRPHVEPTSVEARRAYLVCYYLTMSITVVLRFTPLLWWTDYTEECVRILEESPDALPSDKVLCKHIRLARITERIVREFSLDNPSERCFLDDELASSVCRLDGEVMRGFDGFGLELAQPPALRLAMRHTRLILYEIVLQAELNAAYAEPNRPPSSHKELVRVLTESVRAMKEPLNTALDIGVEELTMLPVLFSVRVTYAIVCLHKVWTLVPKSPTMRAHFNQDQVELAPNIARMREMFRQIITRDKCSPHSKFYFIISLLEQRMVGGMPTNSTSRAADEERGLGVGPMSAIRLPATTPAESPTSELALAPNQNRLHVLSEAAQRQLQPQFTPFSGVSQQPFGTSSYYPSLAAHSPGSQPQLQPQLMQASQQFDDLFFREAAAANFQFDPGSTFTQPDLGVLCDPGADLDMPDLSALVQNWPYSVNSFPSEGNPYL